MMRISVSRFVRLVLGSSTEDFLVARKAIAPTETLSMRMGKALEELILREHAADRYAELVLQPTVEFEFHGLQLHGKADALHGSTVLEAKYTSRLPDMPTADWVLQLGLYVTGLQATSGTLVVLSGDGVMASWWLNSFPILDRVRDVLPVLLPCLEEEVTVATQRWLDTRRDVLQYVLGGVRCEDTWFGGAAQNFDTMQQAIVRYRAAQRRLKDAEAELEAARSDILQLLRLSGVHEIRDGNRTLVRLSTVEQRVIDPALLRAIAPEAVERATIVRRYERLYVKPED